MTELETRALPVAALTELPISTDRATAYCDVIVGN